MAKKKKTLTVKIHPKMMEDLANLPEKEREAVLQIIKQFEQAAANTPVGDGMEQRFEEELKKIADADINPVTEEDFDEMEPEERKKIEDRMKNTPTEH